LSRFSLSNPILSSDIYGKTNKNGYNIDIKRKKIMGICVNVFPERVAFGLLGGKYLKGRPVGGIVLRTA
jgi:hypothetical protein